MGPSGFCNEYQVNSSQRLTKIKVNAYLKSLLTTIAIFLLKVMTHWRLCSIYSELDSEQVLIQLRQGNFLLVQTFSLETLIKVSKVYAWLCKQIRVFFFF